MSDCREITKFNMGINLHQATSSFLKSYSKLGWGDGLMFPEYLYKQN